MRRLAALLLALVSLCVLVSGCPRRPRRVVLGIALTKDSHDGVLQAAREINAQGGIGGLPLVLQGIDWSARDSSPQELLSRARQFAEEPDLLGVVGPGDSASTLTMAAALNQARVPEIVTIATNAAITRIGAYTYRLCISDALQGPALAEYAVRTWGKRRIALVYVSDDYGRGLAQSFEDRARKLGADVVAAIPHHDPLPEDEEETVRSGMRRLAASRPGPDLVVLVERPNAAKVVLHAIRAAALEADVLGSDNMADPILFREAVAEGVRCSAFFQADKDDAETRAFCEGWLKDHSTPPDYGNVFAYDAIQLLRTAILDGGFSREGVRRSLERLSRQQTVLHGAAGEYRIGADHDARRAFFVVECRGGRAVLLKTLQAE